MAAAVTRPSQANSKVPTTLPPLRRRYSSAPPPERDALPKTSPGPSAAPAGGRPPRPPLPGRPSRDGAFPEAPRSAPPGRGGGPVGYPTSSSISSNGSNGSNGSGARHGSTGRRAQSLPPLREKAASAQMTSSRSGANSESPGTRGEGRKATGGKSQQGRVNGFASDFEDWKRRAGLDPSTRVFTIVGAFPGIRQALLARGWVENEDRNSPFFDFKYAVYQRDVGDPGDLSEAQVVNFFARNSEVTSKVGLCNTLQSNASMVGVDISVFWPRCYDMSSSLQVESFVEDFRLTSAACLLRRWVEQPESPFPREAVELAFSICSRRVTDVDQTLDDEHAPLVSDAEWEVLQLCSLKKPGRQLKPWKTRGGAAAGASGGGSLREQQPEAQAPNGSNANSNDDAASDDGDAWEEGSPNPTSTTTTTTSSSDPMREEAVKVLAQLRQTHRQIDLDGFQNIWVLKPAGKSRGRGIQLSARLEKILDVSIGRGAEARWIVQKYIENPLIINAKKFDMRQWVVVTRWHPLSVWFYNDCYVRFSFADYDPQKLKNKFAHLTNNSISKHAEDFEDHCDETMWSSEEMRDYLKSLKLVRNGRPVEDPWEEIVHPAMKRAVYESLLCGQDGVDAHARANSFELFGYDFMIGEDLSVWLIEINSSPDLSYSTSTTKMLVKAMLEDLVKVVFDVEKFGVQKDRPRRKWNIAKMDTGRYELLEPLRRRREEKFPKLVKDAAQLAIQGSSLKLAKPKRGECPRGPHAEDDPRYSAIALLANRAEASLETLAEAEEDNLEEEEEDGVRVQHMSHE